MSLAYLVSDDFPVTICPPMPAAGVRKPRKPTARKAKADKPATLTRADLAALCKAKGLKVLSAHTKRELDVMLASGKQVRPAAYDRQNAKRKAARAAAA